MEVTEDNSNIRGAESSSHQNNLKERGDGGDLIGSLLNLKGNSDSKKFTKPKPKKSKYVEKWELVVNDWKNRERVPFNVKRIAKKYGISVGTVRRIIKRFKERGGVFRASRIGKEYLEKLERLKQILEQEPTLTSGQVGKRLDVTRRMARKMMLECWNGAHTQMGMEGTSTSSKKLLGTSSSSVTAPIEEDNDFGCPGDGGDDLQGNGNRAPCFICDAVDKNVLDSTFPCREMTTSLPAEVERSGRVIWFLKDVLRMRDDDLANVLKEARGKNPDSWEISVCTDPACGGAVERSFALRKEIKRLEGELKKCRKRILERIRSRCSTENGSVGMSEDDNQALLNGRVQERVKRGTTEADSMEFQNDPGEPQVKVEPRDEEYNDLDDDFTALGEVGTGSDNECNPKVVKLEAGDNCRRSSRRKRRTDKFTYEKLGSGANSRAGLGTVPKGKSKLKGAKLGKGVDKEDSAAEGCANEQMYKCRICPALEELDKDEFIAHLAFHSSYPNKCTECNFHFPEGVGNDQVRKHWEEACHPGPESNSSKVVVVPAALAAGNIWPCSGRKCSELFGAAEERDRHEQLVHEIPEPKKTFRCTTCSSQFRDMTELRFHRAIEHPQEAMLSCCYCSIQFEVNSGKEGIKFLNMDQLKEHISQKHPERLTINAFGERTKTPRFLQPCPICGLVFSLVNFSKLNNHIVQEHGQKFHETYTCPVCSKKMRYTDAWGHTKLRHWPDSPDRYPCRFCGKVFRKYWNRKEHEQIHKFKDTKPFQCELCGSSFAVRQYLRIHKRVTHERRLFPSALKKKQQSRKGTSEVPSNPGQSPVRSTENETVKPGQNEGLTGSVTHRDLQYDSCSWFVSSLPSS